MDIHFYVLVAIALVSVLALVLRTRKPGQCYWRHAWNIESGRAVPFGTIRRCTKCPAIEKMVPDCGGWSVGYWEPVD